MEFVVETCKLTKCFHGKEVLHNCNIHIKKGGIYGFLGKNGAGKTTLFKLLLGLLRPTTGTVKVLGMDSVQQNVSILRHVGSLIETPIFYEHLSATDNLKLHLAYMGLEALNIESTLEQVGLSYTDTQPVSTFSLGMRQRLAIARAIIHQPRLLILDEPMNGLDPVGIKEMRDLFHYLVQEHDVTILLSTHILSEIEQISDKIVVIVNGTIVDEITMQEIQANYFGNLEQYFLEMTKEGLHETSDIS